MALRWFGEERLKELRKETQLRIARAGMEIVRYATSHMAGQPTRGKGRNMRGRAPSRPGQFPKRVTQHLARNIGWEVYEDRIGGRWGTNVKYGAIMERARGKHNRPWMSMTNRVMLPKARAIISRGRVL